MRHFRVINRRDIDINREIEKYSATRILISDGIRVDRGILKYSVKIQRILTPYQLERIIAKNSMERYVIIISSAIFDSWSLNVVDDIQTVIEKSAYNGSTIVLEIVGGETVNGTIMV
ncbi:MAG: hypothetical protein RE471_01640 [Ferroplasma sp.]|uniref:hypothetical protein n=1 Tax=Ferroplasma sp. TaxID=2591003 RepID=UPI002815C93A|nr:hypothetical protein [Ferroplasma sp.]WMT51597.1 MAG: hypothetical protein RE471_01640 [Ferroplasma sp.]